MTPLSLLLFPPNPGFVMQRSTRSVGGYLYRFSHHFTFTPFFFESLSFPFFLTSAFLTKRTNGYRNINYFFYDAITIKYFFMTRHTIVTTTPAATAASGGIVPESVVINFDPCVLFIGEMMVDGVDGGERRRAFGARRTSRRF